MILNLGMLHTRRGHGQSRFKGFFHGVSTIIKEDGIGSVYKGVLPTILKVSTAQATRFGVFTAIKDYANLDTPLKNAGAGAFAGGVSVLLFQV